MAEILVYRSKFGKSVGLSSKEYMHRLMVLITLYDGGGLKLFCFYI